MCQFLQVVAFISWTKNRRSIMWSRFLNWRLCSSIGQEDSRHFPESSIKFSVTMGRVWMKKSSWSWSVLTANQQMTEAINSKRILYKNFKIVIELKWNVGSAAIPQFKQSLLRRSPRVYTTIVACTDDDEAVSYLNKWDRELDNLDVVDDYRSERKEVKAAQGSSFPFSFGDYVVKSLIGSIDPTLDNLDEKKKRKKKCVIQWSIVNNFFKIV